MERRRSSGTIAKSMYYSQKRILAFLLTAAMVFTNLGTGLNVSYAGTADQVTFQMKGADLVAAVEEAIESGHEITADDLGFTNGRIAEFEKVFFGAGGAVYEVYPEMEGSSMEAELRVFVRLPEDADDMYMVTGDEEIILLYVNNGEDTISCTMEITRMDDGVEKVKKTKRVTIRSYEDAFGDEEVDIISKPAQDETVAAGSETPAESATEETTVPDGSAAGSGSENGGEDGSTDSSTDDSTGDTEALPSDDTQETETEKEDTADTEADVPEKDSEAGSDEKPERDSVENDSADHDSDTRQEDREEKTNQDEDKNGEGAVPVAAISRHDVPVVSENEDGNQADSADKKDNEPEKEEISKEKDTEPREKEDHGEAKETEKATETEKEKESGTVKETETSAAEESMEPSDSTTEVNAPDTDEMQTTKDSNEESVPESTQAGDSTAGSSDPSADSSDASTAPSSDTSLPSESEQETAPEPVPEDDTKKASTSDLAGMGYCSTAKVYTTSLNQLKAMEDFDGYKVTYASFPEASARILEGPRGVKDGESLTFGVKTQLGYTIDNVTANDEELEAESVTDDLDGSQTAWYTISQVYEEQNIQVYTLETMEHPAFDKSVEVNGVTIRITAPEGVLPADTEIQAEEITEQVESALTEKVDAESDDGTMVSTIIAYDINLMYDGVKLDNSWAEDGSNLVTVSFSGERIEKASMEADQIEILHLETPTQEVQAVSAKAELEGSGETEAVAQVPVLDGISADDIGVDSEGRQELDVSGSASVGQIHFQTDHFSAFTAIFKTSPYLVIANELQDDSVGAENVEYTYEVSITDSQKNKNEKLYLLTENDEAEEFKTAAKTEGDTNTYTFNLKPNGKMKIGNVGPSAEYKVVQTIEDPNNTFIEAYESSRTKIEWTNGSGDSGEEHPEEDKTFEYHYEEGAYGSLVERATALITAFSKCKTHNERKALLKTEKLGAWNDQLRKRLLEDHGLEEWPLASEEGFQDVIDMAQSKFDDSKIDVDLSSSRLNIYFRIMKEGTNGGEFNSPEKMEIVPYLSMNQTDDNNVDHIPNWTAYVAYNSEGGSWYQFLSKSAASFDLHTKSVQNVIDAQPEKWVPLMAADFGRPEEPSKKPEIDGSFTNTGFAYQIEFYLKIIIMVVLSQAMIPQTTVPQETNPQVNQMTIQTAKMEMNQAKCLGTTRKILIPQAHPQVIPLIHPGAPMAPAVQAEAAPQRPAAQADIRRLTPRADQARSRM
ncbi:MAG: doubled motif LPXTG anchor domain-containing protein [Clostridia bacterium]|nr:doubled motif LPXTG anchor domain-containing protein [Clostridia bacterium]